MMADYKQHPLSAAWPSMDDAAFGEFRADIAANGLNTAITVFEGMILDGWHRYSACLQTGTRAKFQEFAGDDAAARKFVVSANRMRRHLDTSQLGMVAATFAKLAHGGHLPKEKKEGANLPLPSDRSTIKDAAELFNVSPRTVKDARVVQNSARPEVIAKVNSGALSVSRAAKDIRASTPRPVRPPPPPPPPKPQLTLIEPTLADILPRTVEQWSKLSAHDKKAHLEFRSPKANMNRESDGEDENLIDWAKYTWNPVSGCLHNCPYCYARDIATHFAGSTGFPNGFTPTLFPSRLAAPLNGRPRASDDPRERRIFTGSMTDLFGRWVPAEWINAVLSVCRQANHWEFLMLTKFPKRMAEFDIPPNVWMGTSVDCQARVAAAEAAFAKVNARIKWLSCEPLIEPLNFKRLDLFDLIVIGGASPSTETPAWIPPYEWLADLMHQADAAACAVFLKSNLYRKEVPGGPRYKFLPRAPEVFHYLAKAINPDEKINAA
jgi:protein gp37